MCQGPNTLSLSKENGTLKYYCFRANCHIAGYIGGVRTIGDIKAISINKSITLNRSSNVHSETSFIIPWYFTNINNNDACISYLRKNNCLEAYYDRACNIMFDPRLNRCVFLVRRRLDGVCVDAAGRLLKYTQGPPKWLRYASSDYPFIVGNSDIGVIVEDCASACSVYSAGYAGISLLGTNFKRAYVSELKAFSKCVICLDKDASRKALEMAKAISPYTDVTVRFLEEDLKYSNKETIKKIIGI